jgi:hypothetical protein
VSDVVLCCAVLCCAVLCCACVGRGLCEGDDIAVLCCCCAVVVWSVSIYLSGACLHAEKHGWLGQGLGLAACRRVSIVLVSFVSTGHSYRRSFVRSCRVLRSLSLSRSIDRYIIGLGITTSAATATVAVMVAYGDDLYMCIYAGTERLRYQCVKPMDHRRLIN